MATLRRLIVMRHATAVSSFGGSDHERPLTEVGTREALVMPQRLAARGFAPEWALVSDATRTTETWWCMADAWKGAQVTELPSFYGGQTSALVAAVEALEDEVGCVLTLGHNPGWSEAASWLSGQSVQLAPAHAALLSASGADWREVLRRGAMRLEAVVGPSGI